MNNYCLKLPKLGESIQSATVIRWLKKEGESIRMDEPLLEVATDKVNSEIPSPVAGIISKLLVKEDQEVETGASLAEIATQDTLSVEQTSKPANSKPALSNSKPMKCSSPIPKKTLTTPECAAALPTVAKEQQRFFTPAVQRLAEKKGIENEVLLGLTGTGAQGRLTKKDLEAHVEKGPIHHPAQQRIKMTKMRKAIADNMVRSFYEAPHASIVAEVDVTEIMRVIKTEKERFLQTHGVKLTITSFLIQALSKALLQFPLLNASIDGEEIILKKLINVGMAVNVEGGLMVPVIKNCQDRNLSSIAKAVNDLSQKARSHQLSLDEIQEGTITLTNFGMSHALMGIPIIRHPEVAIMGAGAIQKRLVVKEDDSFSVRQMIYLTLTFDHRIVDGIFACEFLSWIKSHLESISS